MIDKDIKKSLMLVWPLLIGLALIMTGNGLQGTLLGVRAGMENFPVFATGLIMSLYYFGFLLGCATVPKMIASVGYIRVFAGMASMASTTILLHGVFVDPWMWGGIRILSGLCFAGLFIVSESWLNDIAPNKYRAQIFAAYLFVIHLGLFGGQFFISLSPVSELNLFILVSVFISLSLLPVTLANKPSPNYEEPEPLSPRMLLKKSPMATASVLVAGLVGGAIFGLGPAFTTQSGFSLHDTSLFIAFYVLGCGTIPLLSGYLSDNFDRRMFLIILSFFALCTLAGLSVFKEAFFILSFLLGGFATSLYSVAIAYMNDRLKSSQRVSGASGLIFINGCGACFGPVTLGIIMQNFGISLFFPSLGVCLFILFVFGLYRSIKGRDVDVDDQQEFVPVPTRSSISAFDIQEED